MKKILLSLVLLTMCTKKILAWPNISGSSKQDAFTSDEIVCDEGVQFIPHKECNKFYLCVNYNPVVFNCPVTLYFNPRINVCDFPREVPECFAGTRPPTGTSPHTQKPTEKPTRTTISTTPITDLPSETTDANKFPCPNDPQIYLPHPDNCNLFYRCRNGEFGGVFSCGDELWFHSAWQSCVLPNESDCSLGTVEK